MTNEDITKIRLFQLKLKWALEDNQKALKDLIKSLENYGELIDQQIKELKND